MNNNGCVKEKDELSSAQSAFEKKQADTLDELSDSNTFAFQWSSTADGEFGADAEPYGRISGAGGYQNSGITIVTGLRISQLLVGHDIASIYNNVPDDTKLATLVMQAQGIAYISTRSISATVQARLGLTPEQFHDIINTLSGAQKIQLATALSYAHTLSNEGQFNQVKKRIKKIPKWMDQSPDIDDHGYQTFYATMTKLDELNELIENK
ncbi:hypothetical protein [Aeromonas hydrophila]|uniref:hypothetical protein n=1 Tax=Aeromonas hydrophila TaxID=644 RepID=UPI002B491A8B|nr:hypothetical protein [Aeromonas hydrophila]